MRHLLLYLVSAAVIHCNMVVYRHKDSVPHKMDYVTLQTIFDHWTGKGICVEAAYISPDHDDPTYNRIDYYFKGELDPHFRRD